MNIDRAYIEPLYFFTSSHQKCLQTSMSPGLIFWVLCYNTSELFLIIFLLFLHKANSACSINLSFTRDILTEFCLFLLLSLCVVYPCAVGPKQIFQEMKFNF